MNSARRPAICPARSTFRWRNYPGRMHEVTAPAIPVVLVCKTDRRSAKAAETLRAAGIREVTVLRGGTDGWHQRGLPLD